jgi:hypothetical protein
MAGASSSADALFIPNPGALAGFMSSSAAAMPFHHFSTTAASLIPVSRLLRRLNANSCVGVLLFLL